MSRADMSVDSQIVVEVVPDVTGLDRSFDYLVPVDLEGPADIGSRVRVDLNGRRVAGWIVARKVGVSDVPQLKPVLSWTGIGPDEGVVELCRWSADRWCASRLRPFLVTASPHNVVTRAAPMRRTTVLAEPRSPAASELLLRGGGVLRLPPTADQLPAILSAARMGPTLVVCASVDTSRIIAARLKRAGLSTALMPQDWHLARGGVDVTIGARSAAFAPCPDMAAAVLLDEHEDSLQEERMPTWHARDVLAERCRTSGVPLVLVSPCPTVIGSFGRQIVAPPRERERAGWSHVEVVDRTDEPPWSRSLLSARIIELVRDRSIRTVCVVNAKGQARLLACRNCSALVRCEQCASTMSEEVVGRLDCTVCGASRPRVCATCSSANLSRLRPGVSRLREELERTANRPVAEIIAGRAETDFDETAHEVFIGTNASLHRLRQVDVVAFLDFDRELLAPRYQALEQALALVARAARLVGPQGRGGRVLLQTTLGDHEVVRSAVQGDVSILFEAEMGRRQMLGLPPFSALAFVEGEGVDECAHLLGGQMGVSVSRHRDRLLIRAMTHRALSDAWTSLPSAVRSAVRIEVDPSSV